MCICDVPAYVNDLLNASTAASPTVDLVSWRLMNTLLIHYSEIGTKGANRGYFERRLRDDVHKRIVPTDASDVKLDNSRLVAPLTPDHDRKRIGEALSQVFGIAWYAFAQAHPRDIVPLTAACVAAAKAVPGAKTFKVYVKRVDKGYPISSEDLCRRLGESVLGSTDLKVDLHNHDLGIYVEILPDKALVFTEKIPGLRGMPRGSSGRMLCLFSGGIDSPVAAWMMMRRGAQVDLLHFHPYATNEEVVDTKITALHRVLKTYNPKSLLYLVPHHHYQVAAAVKVPMAYETVLFRRFIFKAGQALATRRNIAALVTGDALGQVASQTLENMAAVQTNLDIPVFQPLISMDKDDIVKAAQKIGTFDLSNQPYKDCCSLLSRKPKTTITIDRCRALETDLKETDLNLPALIPPTLADVALWDGQSLRKADIR
jgi:tRNA uracil 4-sulfurtransferase